MNMNEKNKVENCRIEPKLKLINMDSVEVEQIEWLLYPFIPYGKVTIIQGDPVTLYRQRHITGNSGRSGQADSGPVESLSQCYSGDWSAWRD